MNIGKAMTENDGNEEGEFVNIIFVIIGIANIVICVEDIASRLGGNDPVGGKRIAIDIISDIPEFDIGEGPSDMVITAHSNHLGVESRPVHGLFRSQNESVDLLMRIGGTETSPSVPYWGARLSTRTIVKLFIRNEANLEVFSGNAK